MGLEYNFQAHFFITSAKRTTIVTIQTTPHIN